MRTKSLSEKTKKLARQAEELKELDRAKTRFFTNINHELRTPLTLVIGNVSDLINDPNLKQYEEYQPKLKFINQNAEKLLSLTNEILSLTKADLGTLSANNEATDLRAFLLAVYHNFTSVAQKKNINYQFCPKDLQSSEILLFDRNKAEHILQNLISNAIKFTPEHGMIKLCYKQNEKTVVIMVKDSGPGIPENELEHIFRRYYQGKSTETENETPGFGIGLSLSKEYAQTMEGNLWVESKPGHGSQFYFEFPRIPQTDTFQSVKTAAATPPDLSENTHLYSKESIADQEANHILLVEDNQGILLLLEHILADKYHIHKAHNGRQALDLLKEKHETIELVISDIKMPIMDGYSLLKNIRADQKCRHLPVLFLTALAEDFHRIEAFRLGVDSYLIKPFKKEEVLAQVNSLLENQQKRKDYIIENQMANDIDANSKTEEDVNIESAEQRWMIELESAFQKKLHKKNLKIADIADALLVSENTLRNHLKASTGMTPSEYLMSLRLERARTHLINNHYRTIAEVCYAVGLKRPSHFSQAFKQKYGKSPSEYLKKSLPPQASNKAP